MKRTASEKRPADRTGENNWSKALGLCVRKTRGNISRLADAPGSWSSATDGDYSKHPEGFFEIGNWTSSFFTGMALLAWRQSEDEYYLQQVLRLGPAYREKVFSRYLDTHHDLGFLYSLYSVALYKLTGDKSHREVGLRAAEVLAQRFNRKGNFIRAWGRMDTDEFSDMAIIDCLMNLPLLYWASEQTGNPTFRDIAIRHADMTLRVFVRPDDSVYHAYRFDLRDGKPLRGDTYGGCAVESQWARGTAWAIYGFALSYRHTRERRFLDAALRIGRHFIAQLDGEAVPLWDFRLVPQAPRIRDASAASVAACGFQELSQIEPADESLRKIVERLLSRLASEDYLDFDENCSGIQRFGQVGHRTRMAQNAYTSWGDYFLMEALSRQFNGGETFW